MREWLSLVIVREAVSIGADWHAREGREGVMQAIGTWSAQRAGWKDSVITQQERCDGGGDDNNNDGDGLCQ
jgi:hypothetical protein